MRLANPPQRLEQKRCESRHPMYVGLLVAILAQAVLFGSVGLLVYGVVVWAQTDSPGSPPSWNTVRIAATASGSPSNFTRRSAALRSAALDPIRAVIRSAAVAVSVTAGGPFGAVRSS